MKSVKLVQIAGMLAVTAMLGSAGTATAQTSPAPSSMKTIGAPSAAAKPEIVPSLFVLNSRGATLQGDTLTLTGVTPSAIIFADRPVRSAGHQPTADVIAEWGSGDDSFTKNPPNATLSVFGKDGSVKDAVVVLKNPKLEGDKLIFNVQTLEGDIAGADGDISLQGLYVEDELVAFELRIFQHDDGVLYRTVLAEHGQGRVRRVLGKTVVTRTPFRDHVGGR